MPLHDKDTARKYGLSAFLGSMVLLGLYTSSLYSYLLFHTLIELFSIVVAFAVFILAWNTRQVLQNHYLLFLGIALLFTGAVEMLHTLAYKGFGVFSKHDANLPTQLWIAFRYLLSLSFLTAPFLIRRTLNAVTIFAIYAVVTSLLLWSIFSGVFPDCFVEGGGLTPFKITSEYVIILFFLVALGLLLMKRETFDRRILRLMAAALLCSIASELAFTRYVSVYGPANMIGHFFLLASMTFIYRAIVVTGVAEPSRLLFRNLKLSEEALQKAHDMLEQRVRERTEELARTNEELEAEIAERMRAEGKIRELNRELEQRVIDRTAQLEAANKELEAFSYSVSHDLRAPLRIIDGFSQAIKEDYAGKLDETAKDYIQRVRGASRRMAQLIDALLSLSRQTRGEPNRTMVDMSSLVKTAADDLRKTQAGRRAEFVIADGITAKADPVMLQAVVDNLLGNAWKFTEKRDPARIEFGVLECGIGNAKCEIKFEIRNSKFEIRDRLFCA